MMLYIAAGQRKKAILKTSNELDDWWLVMASIAQIN